MPAKTHLEWSALRDVLVFSRAGSIDAAAKELRVDATTLARRLRRLEREYGHRLLLQEGRRLEITSACRELVAVAEQIEQQVLGVTRRLTAREPSTDGVVRLTAVRSILQRFVLPNLGALRKRHPGLVLELLADNRNLSLSRQEADVAIRLARPSGPDLVARKLADVSYSMYGPPNAGWITYDESLSTVPEAQWVASKVPSTAIVLRANGIELVEAAVRAGQGQALLPDFAATGLTPQGKPVLKREAWLVLHADTRLTPRIRAVADWLIEGFKSKRSR